MILKKTDVYNKPRPGTHIIFYELERPLDEQIQHRLWNGWLNQTFIFVSGVVGTKGGYLVVGYVEVDVVEQVNTIIQMTTRLGQEIIQLEEAYNEN